MPLILILLIYLKLLIKSYTAFAHDLGFSITLKCADSGIRQNLLNFDPTFTASLFPISHTK